LPITAGDGGFKHEFGHIIMNEYGNTDYSWTHDGTSGGGFFGKLDQTPKKGAQYQYPNGNTEVNIMHYHSSIEPKPEHWRRSVGAEKDVKGLLWLCRVKFDD
jgi:hypothetical protein